MNALAVELSKARALIACTLEQGGNTALVYHADADGVASAALAWFALQKLGVGVLPLTPAKGQNVYAPEFSREVDELGANISMIVDTGSRAGSHCGSAPRIVIDHHVVEAPPQAAAFVHDEDEVVYQELALYKISTKSLHTGDIEKIIRDNNARILTITPDYFVIEKTGHQQELIAMLQKLEPYGLIEYSKSGRVAIVKWSRRFHEHLKDLSLIEADNLKD